MLERLYFSDLILADLSIPNGNVYYEIGVRHAAREKGCVLLAADWSKQLFDLAQVRAVRYPLPTGLVDDAAAKAVRDAIRPTIAVMRAGRSPVFEVLRGYPGKVDETTVSGVRDQIDALAAFQAETRAWGALAPGQRAAATERIVEKYNVGAVPPAIALGLLRLRVDSIQNTDGWKGALAYIDALDPDLNKDPYVREQRALALGKLGRHEDSIAELNALIITAGDTSEREGLLGGRFKDLMRGAEKAGRSADVVYYREQSIRHYELGMMLDLNDFYPSSNLPRLYRARGLPDDESRAQTALRVAAAACERVIRRGSTDQWVRPTLLGLAFDMADPKKAAQIVDQVTREGTDVWKLETTLSSIEESVLHTEDAGVRAELSSILQGLKAAGGLG